MKLIPPQLSLSYDRLTNELIEHIVLVLRRVLGQSLSAKDINIFLRHVKATSIVLGGTSIALLIVWPIVLRSIRKFAAKHQQSIVDIAVAIRCSCVGILPTPVTDAIHDIEVRQRSRPVVFGDHIANLCNGLSPLMLSSIARLWITNVVVAGAMLSLCTVADRYNVLQSIQHRFPLFANEPTNGHSFVGAQSDTACMCYTTFQLYDACVTIPKLLEVQGPTFLLRPIQLGLYILNEVTFFRYLPFTTTAGWRAVPESTIVLAVKRWQWPMFGIRSLLSVTIPKVIASVVRYLMPNFVSLAGGSRSSVPSSQAATNDNKRSPSPPREEGEVASVAQQHTPSQPQQPPAAASPSSSPKSIPWIPRWLFVMNVSVQLAKGMFTAAVVALSVRLIGHVKFIDRVPLLGGRGSAYAVAAIATVWTGKG